MAQGDLKGTLSIAQNSITNPTSATGSVAVSVGDLVRVVAVEQGNTQHWGTCTDNLGNTYTPLSAGTTATTVAVRAYYSRVTAAGTLTQIDVAATASSNNAIVCADVFEGPFLSSPLDANPADTTNDTSDPLTCPATGSLAQASEMVLCFYASNGNPTVNADSPNLKSIETNSSTTLNLSLGYQKVSATTSVQPTFDLSGSPTNSVLGTHSFKLSTTSTITTSGSTTAPAATGSGTVERSVTSSGATTAPAATGSGTVERSVNTSGVTTAPAATGAGSVLVTQVVMTGDTAAPAAQGSGTLQRSTSVSGATTAPAAQGSGAVERTINTSGSTTAPAATGAGTTTRSMSVSGATTAPKAAGAGTTTREMDVTGATTAPKAAGAGSVQLLLEATGDTVAPAAQGSGVVTVPITCSGDTEAPAAQGSGVVPVGLDLHQFVVKIYHNGEWLPAPIHIYLGGGWIS